MLSRVTVGTGREARRIACRSRDGRAPALVWFGGFLSDMRSTKAEALDAWAERNGRAFLRFDYSGHGKSEGLFEEGTISRWLEDGLAVLRSHAQGPAIFMGSSMGAWIALLAALALRRDGDAAAPAGLVLIAPAIDFTERLMWERFSEELKEALVQNGSVQGPSGPGEAAYPITRGLIEDGRHHLLMDGTIDPGCPVHILQGLTDTSVPWEHTMRFVECLPGADTQVTIIRDGDHRLSRPVDLDRMFRAVDGMIARMDDHADRVRRPVSSS